MIDHVLRHPLFHAGLAALTATVLSYILTPLVRMLAVRFGLSTRPIEDRWQRRVVARLGGVAMYAAFVGAVFLWVPLEGSMFWLLIATMAVFTLGLVDDFQRLPPYVKLVAQLLIGCWLVIGGFRIELVSWAWISIPLSVLWFVLIMNAFNLLDNMDGLAAGIGVIASLFCAVHAALAQQWPIVTLNAILCGACIGFLRFNVPPAKIYMGDSGSHFLGLSLAALSLMGSWKHSTQLLSVLAVPALVLAVPIFDTLFVTVQRILHRQHPFVGGADHISHRLAVLGLSTRQTLVVLYGVSVSIGMLSLATVHMRALTTVAVSFAVVTGLVILGRYLSRVQVYRMSEREAMQDHYGISELCRPVTLIQTMLLHKRRLVEIVVDFLVVSSMYTMAYLLRFEGVLSNDLQQLVIQSLPLILVVKLTCFAGCGLYRAVWRYVGLADLMILGRAVGLSSLLSACAVLYLWRFEGYSRAVFVIDAMLTFCAIGGSRIAERLFDDWIHQLTARGTPVLILGAGDTGARVLRSMKYDERSDRRAMCFLDDDGRKLGSRIYGCHVQGNRFTLADKIDEHGIRVVLIAITDPPGDLLQHVQQCCEQRSVAWKIVTAGITNAV